MRISSTLGKGTTVDLWFPVAEGGAQLAHIDADPAPNSTLSRYHVLVVDDIFDTGHTLLEVLSFLDDLGPRSIRTAVLVLKQGKQQVALRPDYVGFEIPDVFVVGYGLDYAERYRDLPFVGVLKPSVYGRG